jgi:hypothetical protein
MQLRKEEIHEILKRRTGEEYYNGFAVESIEYSNKEFNDGYILKEEDQHGGEGEGNSFWILISIAETKNPEDKIYIRFDGYYESWNGVEWEGTGIYGWGIVYPRKIECIEWVYK